MLQCSSLGLFTKEEAEGFFGWAARRGWEGREDVDKFGDRAFAAGDSGLAAYTSGEAVSLSQKGHVDWGQGRKEREKPQMFHNRWFSAVVP